MFSLCRFVKKEREQVQQKQYSVTGPEYTNQQLMISKLELNEDAVWQQQCYKSSLNPHKPEYKRV